MQWIYDKSKEKKIELKDEKKALLIHIATEDAQIGIAALLKTKKYYIARREPQWIETKYLFSLPPEYVIPKDGKLNYN